MSIQTPPNKYEQSPSPSERPAPRTSHPPQPPSKPNIFLRNQFRTKLQLPTTTTNHVAIITGGNSGLGLEAASQLLSHQLSHLILVQLNMASYASIQAFVRRVETELTCLDLVLLNAGLINTEFRTVPETGHEEVIQRPLLPSLDMPDQFDINEQYRAPKLLAHMVLRKLGDCVRAEDVVINLADPGFVKGTALARAGVCG
ncbi:hypothetical protein B0T19DRAFT_462814 [Cercophora scortea]|uniref:NAD(P)-binding protein n=1 Tax=Cercophora scortea TaxID=314031 RepID=A0AAE0IE32_9PEZI|nr:hypothetical protein B0T19DRAFT_462814 [Cercophora scortea]